MLVALTEQGLPVPAPLAAMCRRRGLFYRGWLLMDRILNAHTLADMLPERMDDTSLWQRTGAAVARLHRAGVAAQVANRITPGIVPRQRPLTNSARKYAANCTAVDTRCHSLIA